MIDIVDELTAIHREVSRRPTASGDTVAVAVRRTYPAAVEDVWDTMTEPDRLRRWFLPVNGDLRVGGTFQLEGNAGGDILHCEPPRLLRVTFGGATSVVEVRLAPDGGQLTGGPGLLHAVGSRLGGGDRGVGHGHRRGDRRGDAGLAGAVRPRRRRRAEREPGRLTRQLGHGPAVRQRRRPRGPGGTPVR
ncbi:MAG: SRPBCC domain-containing protein [Pseudonocardia sp.]